ncbi:MAG: hypothetical protein ACXWO3_18010, partial [Isosphaeraceae bacterium]
SRSPSLRATRRMESGVSGLRGVSSTKQIDPLVPPSATVSQAWTSVLNQTRSTQPLGVTSALPSKRSPAGPLCASKSRF